MARILLGASGGGSSGGGSSGAVTAAIIGSTASSGSSSGSSSGCHQACNITLIVLGSVIGAAILLPLLFCIVPRCFRRYKRPAGRLAPAGADVTMAKTDAAAAAGPPAKTGTEFRALGGDPPKLIV